MFGRSARVRRGPQAAILTAIVCVSFASVFIRWSASPALTIALYRMGFATVLLSPFLATAKGAQLRTLTVRDYGLLAVVGFALAAPFATGILSLRLVDVAASGVIVLFRPCVVVGVAPFAFVVPG